MPSANKTPNLGLNNWCGTDKPKCSDFVQDNLLIDTAFQNHVSDGDLHFSPQDRARLNNLITTGFYIGSGDAERSLSFDFSPCFALVFQSGAQSHVAVASQDFSCAGISLQGASLTVSQTPAVNLNQSGKTYAYLLFR